MTPSWAHNPKVGGSSPPRATKVRGIETPRFRGLVLCSDSAVYGVSCASIDVLTIARDRVHHDARCRVATILLW